MSGGVLRASALPQSASQALVTWIDRRGHGVLSLLPPDDHGANHTADDEGGQHDDSDKAKRREQHAAVRNRGRHRRLRLDADDDRRLRLLKQEEHAQRSNVTCAQDSAASASWASVRTATPVGPFG